MKTTFMVGRLSHRTWAVAYRCAWCSSWFRFRDRVLAILGARVSHGACERCAANMMVH